MRSFVAIIFLLAMLSCSKGNYTREDLEGTWESRDTAWAKVRMIFSSDTMIMYHPVENFDSTVSTRFNEQMESSLNYRYQYKLEGDTIKYHYYDASIQPAGSHIFNNYFYLVRLTEDSIDLGWGKEEITVMKYVKIK